MTLPKLSRVTYNTEAFVVLSPNALLLPITTASGDYREDALQIYEFGQHSSSYMDHAEYPAPRLVRTFALPISKRHVRAAPLWTRVATVDNQLQRDCRRDSAASENSVLPQRREPKPFKESTPARLCTFVVSTLGSNSAAYMYVTHVSTLLRQEFNVYFGAEPDEPIPWSIWGSSCAACLPGRHMGQRELWATYGDRVAILEPDWFSVTTPAAPPPAAITTGYGTKPPTTGTPTDRPLYGPGFGPPAEQPPPATMWRLVVLDFNQDRVRRMLNRESWPVDPSGPLHPKKRFRPPRVLQGVQGDPQDVFQAAYDEPVVARLPFIETVYHQKLVQCRQPSVEMDSERIILNYVRLPTFDLFS